MSVASQPAAQPSAPAFPDQHTGPLEPDEFRALKRLHAIAPRPVRFFDVVGKDDAEQDHTWFGFSNLMARGWVRYRKFAWSFTERGLRESPDRATVEATVQPPLPERFTPPLEGPLESVDAGDMARLMVVVGVAAMHDPCAVKGLKARDLAIFTGFLEVTVLHGFDANAALALHQEIHVNGASFHAVDLALGACADVPPQDFAEVLKPYGLVWLLTAPAPAEHTVH